MTNKEIDDFCYKCKEYPDLWYNFHYGTFSIQLKFNRRTRRYYLEWSGFNPFPRYEQFYDIVRSKGNFYIAPPVEKFIEYFDVAKKSYFEHLIAVLQVYKVSI